MRIFLGVTVGASIASALIFSALYYFLPKELYVAVIAILEGRLAHSEFLFWLIDLQRLAALAGIGAFVLAAVALYSNNRSM